MSMLVAGLMLGCSNEEEAATGGSADEIRVSGSIGKSSRAVIDAGHADDLEVAFGRFDNPDSEGNWTTVDATRAGGSGNTAIEFTDKQTYLKGDGESVLIGYHPRAVLKTSSDPATVSYTITGDEDIMATEMQTGATDKHFDPFTFQHLLTQLQFRCVGSAEAIKKWTGVTSIKVKDVSTQLTLSLNKTTGASLAATGAANQELEVIDCPSKVSLTSETTPATGYLMLYPVTDLGTGTKALSLEVKATYNTEEKTLAVSIDNINGGVKAGESHLVTLTFTVDGEIAVEAGIAEWKPGNGGSSEVIPGT